MATAPVFNIMNATDDSQVSSHSFGSVKASEASDVLEVHVWNNKDGETAVSDIIEAKVTVVDQSGSAESSDEVVTKKWIEVNVNDEKESDGRTLKWTKIGGQTKAPIRGKGIEATLDSNGGGVISGDFKTKGTQCMAQCKFRVNLPMNSKSGQAAGKIRFEGFYV